MAFTASQIRQDINCFGGFGRQGYGYSVSELREHIGHIMGVDQGHKMIIVGAGNIGRAVALADPSRATDLKPLPSLTAAKAKSALKLAVWLCRISLI